MGKFRFFLAGLGVALFFLGLMELAAHLLPLERFERTMIERDLPIFIPGDGENRGRYVTSPHFERYMSPQSFAIRKPPGVMRIFVLGASAALGWPAEESCAATGFLRRGLDRSHPGRFEVVNAAVMSFGSHRVLDVLREIVDLEPDLVVIWSGNNEYVERNALPQSGGWRVSRQLHRLLIKSRLYRAVRAAIFTFSPSLFRPSGTDLTNLREEPRIQRGTLGRLPEIDQQVLENYRSNLGEMAATLRARGVPGVFCTVPVNLSMWAPYSRPPRFGNPEEYATWNRLMEEGVDLLDRGENREAGARFARVREMTPHYALAAYFEAQALQRLGEVDRARALFMTARDEDARPLRALGTFNEAVRRVAADGRGVRLVDLESAFLDTSGPSLAGMDLFYDYCHPTAAGHARAARAILTTLLSVLPTVSAGAVPVIEEGCPPSGPRARASVFYALGMTYGNNGLDDKAEEAYRSALEVQPDFSEALSNLGALLGKRGSLAEAERLSRQALETSPKNASALMQVALISLYQGRHEEAAAFAQRILAGNPQSPQAHEILGDVATRQGEWDEASRHYREALAQGGESATLRRRLGDAYRALGRESDAIREWRSALELDPLDQETRARLQSRPAATAPGGTTPSPP